MTKTVVGSAVGFLFLLLVTACFRNETSHLTVRVPDMATEIDARIATNAALNEVVGSVGTLMHDFEFNLETQTLIYHEGRQLRSPQYLNMLISSLADVGMAAEIQKVVFSPIKPRLMPDDGILDQWPDRHSALIKVEGMDTITEANIVADAIAFVRNGGDDPRVVPDLGNRELNITYNNVQLSEKNITEAIACSGYSANGVPPKQVQDGWSDYVFLPLPY